MAKKETHRCIICNTGYNSCDFCDENVLYTPYRSICDTERHYQIYLAISMLRGKVMNELEVRESLNHLNVTTEEIKTFIPAVQEILLPIMEEVIAENEVVKKTDEYTGEPTEKTIKKK